MNLAVFLLILFIVIMFTGSMIQPIVEDIGGIDMGASANPLKLMVPLFVIISILVMIVRISTER